MYLVENDHPAIITREQYDAAQALLDNVSKKGSHKDVSLFAVRSYALIVVLFSARRPS